MSILVGFLVAVPRRRWEPSVFVQVSCPLYRVAAEFAELVPIGSASLSDLPPPSESTSTRVPHPFERPVTRR